MIHREDDEIYESLEVELIKKRERGLGLSIVGKKSGPGVFISEVVKGGAADVDGRLVQVKTPPNSFIMLVRRFSMRETLENLNILQIFIFARFSIKYDGFLIFLNDTSKPKFLFFFINSSLFHILFDIS